MSEAIMNRQLVEDQFHLNEEKEVKALVPLRPAESWKGLGLSEQLGHFAEYMDEAVPASAPLMDWMFGEKPTVENHDEEWWTRHRPRPLRGETADPSIPGKEREEYERIQRERARAAKDQKDEEERIAKEEEEKRQARLGMEFERRAVEEAMKRRLSFFGRPAQKFTLKKRDAQLERNEWEHQAAMFAHLKTDAEQELKEHEGINKKARSDKNKAAAAAASFRAEEKGARAAAKSLGLGGKQLVDAKKATEEAAAKFAMQAAEQEEIARKKRIEEEQAAMVMTKEEEKKRVCEGQIKYLKGQAKEAFEEAAEHEVSEIKALVAEKLLLEEFISVWESKKVPENSPLAVQKQNKIDMYDLRGDVVAMEMQMFVHMYTQEEKPAKKYPNLEEGEPDVPWHFAYKITEKGPDFLNLPDAQLIEWKPKEQTPGMVCLGQSGVGRVMANRKKVVLKAGQIPPAVKKKGKEAEKAWEDLDLDEEVCEDIGNRKNPIVLQPFRFAPLEGGVKTYLSREGAANGETKNDSALTPEDFKRLWGGDSRHRVSVKVDKIKVLLRHPPVFKWLATWIPTKPPSYKDDKLSFEKLLYKGPGPISSFNLGPIKKPFVLVVCPALHPQDQTGNIDGNDGQPRLIGRVLEWTRERNADVKDGDIIGYLTVSDPRKSGKKGEFTPKKWQAEVEKEWEKECAKSGVQPGPCPVLEDCKDALAHMEHKKIYVDASEAGNQINRVALRATADGILTGMLRDVNSRVVSFDDVASIDVGEKGWQKVLLPVAEWPGP